MGRPRETLAMIHTMKGKQHTQLFLKNPQQPYEQAEYTPSLSTASNSRCFELYVSSSYCFKPLATSPNTKRNLHLLTCVLVF